MTWKTINEHSINCPTKNARSRALFMSCMPFKLFPLVEGSGRILPCFCYFSPGHCMIRDVSKLCVRVYSPKCGS